MNVRARFGRERGIVKAEAEDALADPGRRIGHTANHGAGLSEAFPQRRHADTGRHRDDDMLRADMRGQFAQDGIHLIGFDGNHDIAASGRQFRAGGAGGNARFFQRREARCRTRTGRQSPSFPQGFLPGKTGHDGPAHIAAADAANLFFHISPVVS